MYSWYQPASCYLDGASRRANQRWRPIYGDRVGSLRTTPFYRQQITIARSPCSGTAEPVYYLLSCTCSHQTVAPICLLCRLISVDCLPSWTFFEDVCFIRDISAWQTDNCLLTYLLTYLQLFVVIIITKWTVHYCLVFAKHTNIKLSKRIISRVFHSQPE